MAPWVENHPYLERYCVTDSSQRGYRVTKYPIFVIAHLRRREFGTRSALPPSMNPDANETLCGTCDLPLYGAPSCVVCDREAAYKLVVDVLVALKGAYKVLLASVGNPDFGQDNRRSLPGVPRKTLRVASLADASRACRAYIEHYELGGGNWLGGEVKKDGKVIAKISYNGRAWEPGDWLIKEIQLSSAVGGVAS